MFSYLNTCSAIIWNELGKEEAKENKNLQPTLLSHALKPEKHKQNIKEVPYICACTSMMAVTKLHVCNLFLCFSPLDLNCLGQKLSY